ncbi:hypothetical protein BJ508DRAFT_410405 [Ascobolus immersus RN42]|uniref:Uncharacterized protein n=1 Tax=Ascobolus immersus RN42 TaxID=1160509 RepID=A0A3N4IQF1_ASCIM|nr:hypothetical protein BJ508DRAFT_410405 [Ascobolus immersus RN42]
MEAFYGPKSAAYACWYCPTQDYLFKGNSYKDLGYHLNDKHKAEDQVIASHFWDFARWTYPRLALPTLKRAAEFFKEYLKDQDARPRLEGPADYAASYRFRVTWLPKALLQEAEAAQNDPVTSTRTHRRLTIVNTTDGRRCLRYVDVPGVAERAAAPLPQQSAQAGLSEDIATASAPRATKQPAASDRPDVNDSITTGPRENGIPEPTDTGELEHTFMFDGFEFTVKKRRLSEPRAASQVRTNDLNVTVLPMAPANRALTQLVEGGSSSDRGGNGNSKKRKVGE